ncbi:2-amino-4-hydroxy-6-hydroxymethyldihydropteridine diphosphokinase [Paucimonas lemoignei]|uniref:2-amino-4-hydroxy-6-hydroxymethyldihydropteridine pyrophosphokinase n=1 Tax=Paucimonas lemoignei TaxID=29443 RepID=A0A4R3HZ64_PAULE|nr:2-amino-4-hydroxy-6-hydroxymethyldihydropteridine diphosphokinase [Paucimonas lemoignei]TCS36799.1 2-amino-4-hydroxy-6-hydroxymethyldihydropteridine diphosphokinase [Paucimonas lemoignei]
MMATEVTAYIGIGANLGDARKQVEEAIAALNKLPQTRLLAQSSLFRTAPVDAAGDDYINAVASIKTGLSAQDLLEQLQALEQAAGRERPYRNAPRTLDLDILLYGDQIIATPTLTVPHPRLTQRAFALIPLIQIAPFIAIPGHGPAHQFAPQVADQAIGKI